MTRGTKAYQDNLIKKGYIHFGSYISPYEASEMATHLRKCGYKAQALELTTRIKGYHDYCVYYKIVEE